MGIELCKSGGSADPADLKINTDLKSLTEFASVREMEGSR
jgi:hypothetical protein